MKDTISSNPVINHNKLQSQIITSDRSNSNDIEVASNGSHIAAEKGNILRIIK